MSDRKDLRFAVVGCGLMGQRHADILRATPGLALACVQDARAESAQKVADGAGVPVAASYDAILADPAVDGVVLCLPSGLHADYGIRAARAGKHVVTEKPIDITPDKGRALADECEKAGVVCAVISQNRFADGLAALKAALDRGDLGQPVLARASVKWFRHDPYYTGSDWRGTVAGEGGGVLMNQAVHNMDLMIWLFGVPAVTTGMVGRNREVIETEDVGVGMMRWDSGLLATFEASTSTFPGFNERIEVHSKVGSCIIEKGQIIFWKHEKDLPQPEPPAFEPATDGLDAKYLLFQRQWRNIAAAIRGEAALAVKTAEAVAVVETTLKLY